MNDEFSTDYLSVHRAWESFRKGKGLHACLKRTQKLLQRHAEAYVWRADITKFYNNVGHITLVHCLQRKIGADKRAMDVVDKIINSYRQLAVSQSRGIPIGNLASQIFSNVYLNEFDRFVRHHIRPLAYVRYGDDFAVFCPTRRSAHTIRERAADRFLSGELGLTINPKNDIVVAGHDGLKFLGHNITQDSAVVDEHTTKSVLGKLNWRNIASYEALFLTEVDKKSLDWILLEEYVDI